MIIDANKLPFRFDGVLPPHLAYRPYEDHMWFFDVPAQVLVTKIGICAPKQGRYWSVDLYEHENYYVSAAELRGKKLPGGLSSLRQAHITEIWQNHGDDRHIEYRLSDFALVPDEFALESPEYRPWLRHVQAGT